MGVSGVVSTGRPLPRAPAARGWQIYPEYGTAIQKHQGGEATASAAAGQITYPLPGLPLEEVPLVDSGGLNTKPLECGFSGTS